MEALKQNHNRIISPKKAKKLIIFLIFTLFFDFFLFPAPVIAAGIVKIGNNSEKTEEINNTATMVVQNNLPEKDDVAVKSVSLHTMTAYNSEQGQTDDSPCITANGFNVCEHGVEDTVAANFLPFGAKVRMPELYGDKIFTVRDRMNSRYKNRLDIWMVNKADAMRFGVKTVKIEVLALR